MEVNKIESLSIEEAAKIMGKSCNYIRVGLQNNRFDFGSAVKRENTWSYHIIKSKFLEYLNIYDESAIDEKNVKAISKVISKGFIAYRVTNEVVRKKLKRKCACDECGYNFNKFYLVATNDKLLCDNCMSRFEDFIKDYEIDRKVGKYKMGYYENLLSDK